MGTSARLKAIADALAKKPVSDASSPATVAAPSSSRSFVSGPPRGLEGTEQARVPPRPFACISNLPRASGSSSSTPSQVDRNQRLKDIQQGLALARKDVVTVKPETPSKCTPSRPSLKRPSSSAPEAEPQAKRAKLPVDAPVIGSGIDHQPAATPKPYPSTAPPTIVATSASSNKVEVPSKKIAPPDRYGNDFIAKFFAGYPRFHYHPSSPVWKQFYRMGSLLQWGEDAKDAARQKLQDALTLQFNSMYGTDVEDIKNWQLLCHVLGIAPVSENLDECRHVVLNTHVNLIDLVMRKTDEPVKLFKTEHELSKYTRASGKIFPRANVHAGGLLKFLLRRIFHPPSKESKRYWENRGDQITYLR